MFVKDNILLSFFFCRGMPSPRSYILFNNIMNNFIYISFIVNKIKKSPFNRYLQYFIIPFEYKKKIFN